MNKTFSLRNTAITINITIYSAARLAGNSLVRNQVEDTGDRKEDKVVAE